MASAHGTSMVGRRSSGSSLADRAGPPYSLSAYLLKRVAAFALALAALELLASLAWLLLHGTDRATIATAGPEIERLSAEIGVEREWLAARAGLAAELDSLDDRIRLGAAAFESRAALDSARARRAEGVQTWNEGIEEHGTRAARAESLAVRHDSLVAAYAAAYRRAYPGWLLLSRPEPPRQAAPP